MPRRIRTVLRLTRTDATEIERLTAQHAEFVRDRLMAGDDLVTAHKAAQGIQDEITALYAKRAYGDE
ncbi:MAG: hypothetical protein MRY74_10920 [Neomegalonema sp.]|nr:hypothetical protein [Neomegalonema sp.]